MEGMFINVENANFICRGCLCDCTSTVSFNIHSFKILQNKVVCDILSECTSIEVSHCFVNGSVFLFVHTNI